MSSHLQTGAFYGAVRRQTEWAGIVATEVHHAQACRLPRHCHQAAYFCLLLEGNYREQAGSRTIEYRPFTVGFHPPDLVHSDEVGSRGGRFFCLELGSHWLGNLRELSAGMESAPSLCGENVVWLAMSLYRIHGEDSNQDQLIVENLVAEMLSELSLRRLPEEKTYPAWLGAAKELLRSDVARNWTLAELAAEVGVHPVHLSRVFRQRQRQTAGDYLNRLRVQSASEEMLRGEVRLAELALTVGFADQSHFTRVFKKITGQTPAAFRAAVRAH